MRATKSIITHLAAALAVAFLNGSAFAEEEVVEVIEVDVVEEVPADQGSMDAPPVDAAPPESGDGAEAEEGTQE